MIEYRVAAMPDKKCLISVLVLLVVHSAILAGQGTSPANQENSEDKTAVIRLENRWLAALLAADVDTIAEVVADDFVRPAPDSGQFVDKSQLLRFYRSHLSPQNPNAKRMEGLTVTVYGSTALARGTLITTDPKGQVVYKLLFTDVFVKRQGKWQAVSAQEDKVTRPDQNE